MRCLARARTATLLLVVMASIGASGCSSQTRLGYLIPAHRNSDASKGEVVRVNFYPDPEPSPAPPDERGTRREFAALAPLAAFGAKLAVDYVSSELEKEAKRYEAQFTGRVIASTQQLGRAGYLVVERWVEPRLLNIADGEVPASVGADYEKMTRTCDRLQASADAENPPPPAPFSDLTRDDTGATEGKLLVFLFVARIVPAEVGGDDYRAGPFAITPQFVWLWKTKAKVVDLSLSESWKIWQWIGALALKTEEKANVKVDVQIKAISADKKAGTGIVEVNTSAPIVAQMQVDLSEPQVHWLSQTSGIWFDVPRYWSSPSGEAAMEMAPIEHGIGRSPAPRGESATRESSGPSRFPEGVGFALFDVVVSDSDASNVRKVLESGTKKLKENKDSIADSVSSIFE